MGKTLIALLLLASFSAHAQFNIPTTTVPVLSKETITLTWLKPTTRENGDVLKPSEIAGYEIHATFPGGKKEIIKIAANATNYTMPISAAGVYEFSILAVDTKQQKSELSNTVNTDIEKVNRISVIEGLRIKFVCNAGAVCVLQEVKQ